MSRRAPAYADAIARRRDFRHPGFKTLADAGMDGPWVSPIHLRSGNLTGPMLIRKDWLDFPSAVQHRTRLREHGFLPQIPFNRVMDLALPMVGLTRADIYISPVFHLLPPERSSGLLDKAARASFASVGQHELMGRTPIALGLDSSRVLSHFGVAHINAPHPSARIGTYAKRAALIANALEKT